jgi:hypothetical protein
MVVAECDRKDAGSCLTLRLQSQVNRNSLSLMMTLAERARRFLSLVCGRFWFAGADSCCRFWLAFRQLALPIASSRLTNMRLALELPCVRPLQVT